jgi:ribosomal protein L28
VEPPAQYCSSRSKGNEKKKKKKGRKKRFFFPRVQKTRFFLKNKGTNNKKQENQ